MSETRDLRLDRLEANFQDIKAVLGRLEPLIIRIDERLNSTLPHLATKAELETKPGKGFLAGAVAVLLAALGIHEPMHHLVVLRGNGGDRRCRVRRSRSF